MVFVTPLTTLISISTLSVMASAATVQKPFLMMPPDAAQNRQAVKDMFLYSYDAYKFVLPCGVTTAAESLTVPAGSMRRTTIM